MVLSGSVTSSNLTSSTHDSMVSTGLRRIAPKWISSALLKVPRSAAEDAVIDATARMQEGSSFFSAISARGLPVTPGIWAFYLVAALNRWDATAQAAATHLPSVRRLHERSDVAPAEELIDRAVEAVADLALAERHPDHESAAPESLMARFHAFSLATERFGASADAYNLAVLAMSFTILIKHSKALTAAFCPNTFPYATTVCIKAVLVNSS